MDARQRGSSCSIGSPNAHKMSYCRSNSRHFHRSVKNFRLYVITDKNQRSRRVVVAHHLRNLRILIHNKLNDPKKQTNFENCVADVNIPVGEVFTSPILKGTSGILEACTVYLEGLKYEKLHLYNQVQKEV